MAGCSRVVVGGLPGVGKTTILTGAVRHISECSRDASLVVFGTMMLQEAKKIGVGDRDSLRMLPVAEQRRLQVGAAERIAKMSTDYVFVDTHFLIRTPEGLWPGLPMDVIKAIDPTHLVFVQAPVNEVISRRRADKTRKRDVEPEVDISLELEFSKQFMVVASALTGAPMKIINNLDGRAEDATDELLKTVKAPMVEA